MHSYPSLSIIIPSYNQGLYIERTLLSIFKQDYPGEIEVIVSDGGSQDQTVEILKRYSQVKWWSESDKGFVDAVTKGFNIASGEVLAIQSSDDFYLKDAFQTCISQLVNEDLDIISGFDAFLLPDKKTFSLAELQPGDITPKSLLLTRVIPQHCAFFHRRILNTIGGLRQEVDTCADIDFWYRSLHFFKGKFIPFYVGVYQKHENQRTQVLSDWYSSLVRMVESCETDDFYSRNFKFSKEDKENLYVRWELQFDILHASEDTRKNITTKLRDVLVSSSYSIETKQYLYSLGVQSGLLQIQKRSFVARVADSILDRSFFSKVNGKFNRELGLNSNSLKTIKVKDINWWQ